jgi:hypothetical protein
VLPETVQPDPEWPPRPSPPDQVLKLAASANIIEMTGDHSALRFYHQLLQEYFAAREMLGRSPEKMAHLWRWPWLEKEMPKWVRPEDNYDPLPPPPPTNWEETTIMAAGLMPENDDGLVRALNEINPVIAGRCLYEGRAEVRAHASGGDRTPAGGHRRPPGGPAGADRGRRGVGLPRRPAAGRAGHDSGRAVPDGRR